MIIKKIAVRNQINIVIINVCPTKSDTQCLISNLVKVESKAWTWNIIAEVSTSQGECWSGINTLSREGRGCYDSQELFHHGLTPYTIYTWGGGRGRSQGQQFETVLPGGTLMTQKHFLRKTQTDFPCRGWLSSFYQLIIKLNKLISSLFWSSFTFYSNPKWMVAVPRKFNDKIGLRPWLSHLTGEPMSRISVSHARVWGSCFMSGVTHILGACRRLFGLDYFVTSYPGETWRTIQQAHRHHPWGAVFIVKWIKWIKKSFNIHVL